MTYSNRKKYLSDICIGGKRISSMREIAKATFEDSFLSIEIEFPKGIFVVRVDDTVDIDRYNKFIAKYNLCKVIVYKPIDISLLKK